MKKLTKEVGCGIAGVLGVLVVVIGLSFYGLEMKRFFAPRHAEIDRQVFEQTPSFVHGKAQYLSRLRLKYEMADTESARASLRVLIKSEAAAVNNDLLPLELQNFLISL